LRAGEVQNRAAAPLVHGLAERRSKLVLSWLLWRCREILRRNDAAWGQVGYALSSFRRMRQVTRWLADWRQRSSVEPWMLFNYCLALRHLGRYEEANEVAAHAITAWPHREGASDLHLFLAVEAALAGQTAEARAHLSKVAPRDGVLYDRQMIALAEALAEIQTSPRAERKQRFRAIRHRLAPDFGQLQVLYAMRDVRRTLKRACEVLAREGAGLDAWVWFRWKLHWQWSLLGLLPVIIAIGAVSPALVGVSLAALAWGLRARAQES
jgi:hypothetical protein